MTDTVEQLGPDEVLQEARELLRFYQSSDPSKPYTCSVIADCISMIEALRAASEWRDISTAPRDGTPILCWRPDPEFSPITGIDLIWWEPAERFWTQDGDTPIAFVDQLTHWMPLPAPPQRNEVKK